MITRSFSHPNLKDWVLLCIWTKRDKKWETYKKTKDIYFLEVENLIKLSPIWLTNYRFDNNNWCAVFLHVKWNFMMLYKYGASKFFWVSSEWPSLGLKFKFKNLKVCIISTWKYWKGTWPKGTLNNRQIHLRSILPEDIVTLVS